MQRSFAWQGVRRLHRAGPKIPMRAVAGATQMISVRLPSGGPGLNLTVDRGDGGHPDMREQVVVNTKTLVARREPFAAMTRGQRWRAWVRFTHTGEAGGWWGETLALLAACGAILLSVTGLLLSLDRLRRWQRTGDREPARTLVAAGQDRG